MAGSGVMRAATLAAVLSLPAPAVGAIAGGAPAAIAGAATETPAAPAPKAQAGRALPSAGVVASTTGAKAPATAAAPRSTPGRGTRSGSNPAASPLAAAASAEPSSAGTSRGGRSPAGSAPIAVIPSSTAPAKAPAPTPPRRVVSVNLCTDQIAMALAAPGQLVSVSHLAREPQSSAMVAEAQRFPVNHGRAEEVYLLAPDLVLAGGYGGASVALLHRLGVPVVEVPPPNSLEDARAAIAQVGAALGREAEAAAMLADFDTRLAALSLPTGGDRPLAATWGPNGYSSGGATLAGDVLRAAGFSLLADRLGMQGSGYITLESLVMADPALIVTGTPYPGASRAEEIVTHPALSSLSGRVVHVPDPLWTCPTPRLLDALALLAAEARIAATRGAP